MIEVIEFKEEFINECAGIYVDTFNAEPWNDHWSYDTALKRISAIYYTPGFWGLAACDGKVRGAVLGNIEQWYEGFMYNLKEMFVQQDLRRSGMGSQLLAESDKALKPKGVHTICLFTSKGDMTEDFYRKNGYAVMDGMIMMSKGL